VGRGASVNEVDVRSDDKFTPLHWAAHAGSLEVGGEYFIAILDFVFKVYALASMAIS
jgi:hypothetical protein